MILLFVCSRTYSKALSKCLLFLSARRRAVEQCSLHLTYPPNVDAYLKEMKDRTRIAPEKIDSHIKNNINKLKTYELQSLHKYYNTVLKTKQAAIVYHEILKRQSKLLSMLSPFGLRKFLAAHLLLGGIGVQTTINRNSKLLIASLGRACCIANNTNYREFLNHKTVSLCGGAPSPRDNKEEVLSSDVVVRLNRTIDNFELANVVYFRSEFLENLNRKGEIESLVCMPFWVSIKTVKQYFRIKLKKMLERNKVVVSLSTDGAFELGKLNAIPNVCLDLIYNGSQDIRIFDTDLNLSQKHKTGHRDEGQPVVDFKKVFGEHPSYVQYCALKYFSDSGYVTFEENPSFDVNWGYRKFIRSFISVYEKV